MDEPFPLPTPLPCRECHQSTIDPQCLCASCRERFLREFADAERRGIKPQPIDRREYRG